MSAPALSSETWPVNRSLLIRYFLGAYGFTWALQLAILVFRLPYQGAAAQVLYDLSILGPLLSAVVITMNHAGRIGLRALFSRALQWRFSWVWYLMAIFTVAALKLLSVGIDMAMGGGAPDPFLIATFGGILFAIVTQFGYVMFAEEVGWRAFALPRLLERYGALGGTLVLGVIHASWHLPMFFVIGSNQYGTSFLGYLFVHLAWATAMTFLYYRSGKSSLPCLLFHAALNVPAFVFGTTEGSTFYLRILYGILIMVLVPFLPRPLFRRTASVPGDGAGADTFPQNE